MAELGKGVIHDLAMSFNSVMRRFIKIIINFKKHGCVDKPFCPVVEVRTPTFRSLNYGTEKLEF